LHGFTIPDPRQRLQPYCGLQQKKAKYSGRRGTYVMELEVAIPHPLWMSRAGWLSGRAAPWLSATPTAFTSFCCASLLDQRFSTACRTFPEAQPLRVKCKKTPTRTEQRKSILPFSERSKE